MKAWELVKAVEEDGKEVDSDLGRGPGCPSVQDMISYISLNVERGDIRIKPEKKVIDMSVCIESKVDCEVKNGSGESWLVDRLVGFDMELVTPYDTYARGGWYEYCRPRMNHIMAHDMSDKCPIPEGFMVEAFVINYPENAILACPIGHSKDIDWGSVVQYKITGIHPDYTMEGEE